MDSHRGRRPPIGSPAPQPPGRQGEHPSTPSSKQGPTIRSIIWLVAVAGTLIALLVLSGKTTHMTIPYNPTFLTQVHVNNISQINSQDNSIQGMFKHPITFQDQQIIGFTTEIPAFADSDALYSELAANDVAMTAKAPSTGSPFWQTLLLFFGPIALIGLLIYYMMRRAGAGLGGITSFGRSRARRFEPSTGQPSFAEVAGIDEAKGELAEVVDFLRQPDKYLRLGGRIPHGVLLVGPPGTGKTLLARAVAGEAGVPFFWISAAEFIEMFVGVGASRVRDLFAQAKQAAPAIVFIDELDAIGRTRGAGNFGAGSGHDEREQTLNQILTEMDGFDSDSRVIVLAATNRPDVLDAALLRPGRFDRRVAVQPPDRAGREAILSVHVRYLTLASDVDLGRIAATAVGMVGADLANLVNESALLAAHRNRDEVGMDEFMDAMERIILGSERRIIMSPDERRRTAYHEAGHAVVGMLTPGGDPVRKISIIPRGVSLGTTLSAPDADQLNYGEQSLLAKIRVALGGRVAEEIVFGEPSAGAESDITQLTAIAVQMVTRWGMSDRVGPIAVASPDAGLTWPAPGTSPDSQSLVAAEVRRIVEEAHAETVQLLTAHRAQLDALASELLEHETLDQAAAYAAAGMPQPHPIDVGVVVATDAVVSG